MLGLFYLISASVISIVHYIEKSPKFAFNVSLNNAELITVKDATLKILRSIST